jgi:hypothetical protein
MSTPNEILFNALVDIDVIAAGQTAIEPEDVPICFQKFNRRVSSWNLKRTLGSYEYTQVFTTPTSANSYTIGATADAPALVVTSGRAPVEIASAKRVTSDGYETPLAVLAFQEWDQLSKPDLGPSLPEAVYLQTIPKLPKLWCYPKPAAGQLIRLSWRVLLNTITLAQINTNIDFQDGVEDALTLTLSEDLCLSFQKTISQDLKDRAAEARLAVMSINGVPNIAYPDCMESADISPDIAAFLSRSI